MSILTLVVHMYSKGMVFGLCVVLAMIIPTLQVTRRLISDRKSFSATSTQKYNLAGMENGKLA